METDGMAERLNVGCPCCGARLIVDSSTGDVLSAEPTRSGPPKSFEQAVSDVHSGGARREQAFSEAFDRTRRQEDILEKKFEEARKKAADDKSPPRSPFDTD